MERKIIVIVENERLFSGDVDRYNFYRWLAGGLGRFSEYAETNKDKENSLKGDLDHIGRIVDVLIKGMSCKLFEKLCWEYYVKSTFSGAPLYKPSDLRKINQQHKIFVFSSYPNSLLFYLKEAGVISDYYGIDFISHKFQKKITGIIKNIHMFLDQESVKDFYPALYEYGEIEKLIQLKNGNLNGEIEAKNVIMVGDNNIVKTISEKFEWFSVPNLEKLMEYLKL